LWPGVINSVADIKLQEIQGGADGLGRYYTFYLKMHSLNWREKQNKTQNKLKIYSNTCLN